MRARSCLVMIIVLLVYAVIAYPEQFSYPLIDKSQRDSPISLSGTVDSKDDISAEKPRTSFMVRAELTNRSGRDILLAIVRMEMKSTNGFEANHTRINEYFFSSDVFRNGATEAFQDIVVPLEHIDNENMGHPTRPKASARVAFVQFLDGSTWGESEDADEVLLERQETWRELRSLADTYETNGEQEFVNRLAKPSSLQTIKYLQGVFSNDKSITKVITEINQLLSHADLHRLSSPARVARSH